MRPEPLTAGLAADARNLSGTLESRLGGAGTLCFIVEQNTPQIFVQVEKIEFT
jgi:hypothetical protein